MEYIVRVVEIDKEGNQEKEIFMQRVPEENLRSVYAAANMKPRRPRTPAEPKAKAKP